jgi:large subunit ribosomal protein L9
MKVILIKDVKGIGRAHEEVEVSHGHALNYLIPGKFAIAATLGAAKVASSRKKVMHERKELDAKLLAQNIASLADANIVIKAKANEKGHLYNAVGESEISAAAKGVHIDLPEEAIKLEKPFKELGTFDVPVAAGETFGKFAITIEAE